MRPIAFLTQGRITGMGIQPLALLTAGMLIIAVIPVPSIGSTYTIGSGGGMLFDAGKRGQGLHQALDTHFDTVQPDWLQIEDDEMLAVIMRFMEVSQ